MQKPQYRATILFTILVAALAICTIFLNFSKLIELIKHYISSEVDTSINPVTITQLGQFGDFTNPIISLFALTINTLVAFFVFKTYQSQKATFELELTTFRSHDFFKLVEETRKSCNDFLQFIKNPYHHTLSEPPRNNDRLAIACEKLIPCLILFTELRAASKKEKSPEFYPSLTGQMLSEFCAEIMLIPPHDLPQKIANIESSNLLAGQKIAREAGNSGFSETLARCINHPTETDPPFIDL